MITQAQLKELLHYDPDTGIFTWLQKRHHIQAGSIAGSINVHGYRIDGKMRIIGSYDTKEDAGCAYMQAAEKHFGEFARAS